MKFVLLLICSFLISLPEEPFKIDSSKITFKGFTKKFNLDIVPTNDADNILMDSYLQKHDIDALKIIAKN